MSIHLTFKLTDKQLLGVVVPFYTTMSCSTSHLHLVWSLFLILDILIDHDLTISNLYISNK